MLGLVSSKYYTVHMYISSSEPAHFLQLGNLAFLYNYILFNSRRESFCLPYVAIYILYLPVPLQALTHTIIYYTSFSLASPPSSLSLYRIPIPNSFSPSHTFFFLKKYH